MAKTEHTVVSGDTLFSLAKKYGTTVEKLKTINSLKSDALKTGQTLKLPQTYTGRFVLQNEENKLFENFAYEITLSDGTVCTGTTDSQGCTEVIKADSGLSIREIKIISGGVSCCSHLNEFAAGGNTYAYAAAGVLEASPGKMPKNILLKTEPRWLTKGEIDKLKPIFGNSLDYTKVRIHKGQFIRGQRDNVAMTPVGAAYYPARIYRSDFSDTLLKDTDWHLFVHEMVHVWQHQRKQGYVLAAAVKIAVQGGYEWDPAFPNHRIAYNYRHLVEKRKYLSEFNIEQQADIIADYFIYKGTKDLMSIEDRLRLILQEFIHNPLNEKLLPKSNDIFQTVWDDPLKAVLDNIKRGGSN